MNVKKRHLCCSLFAMGVVLSACQSNGSANEPQPSEPQQEAVENEQEENMRTISYTVGEDDAKVSVDELIQTLDGELTFDELHRTLEMTIHEDQYRLIDGVTVLERNGEYLATDEIYLIEEEGELYLPVAFLEVGLGLEVTFQEKEVAFQWFGPAERVGGPPEGFDFDEWDVDTMVDYLSFLERPIQGAQVSTIDSHLPGAPREYRNGFHEGIDWYDFATGGNISRETPVYAMAEGIVVRADHDFEDYESPEVRNADLALTAELGETPEYIFDRLRGQQVWVQYPNGVMNRFAHLSGIPEDLQVGDRVNAETVIGYVGNSGTSSAVNGNLDDDLHLHQDLLIYGELFWKPLTLEETKEVLQKIWP
ncbi:M23 family metallopeptidase [Halalkalibacterium halodurans]|uniref:M23 family metallopeptidase n=1 Tax=Halalkalibacterium halodurans TaxID=86665 RepID=UPI002E2420E6|nr:M23 family metallopeptidase [Halalkalibacterium halodurans]